MDDITEPIDFASSALNKGRLDESRGDKRSAMKSYAHAWRAATSNGNITLAALAREEMFSMSLLIHDTVFSSVQYRDLISVFSLDHRDMAAWAHHDLGKIFRDAWQHGEILNPGDSIKHLLIARDEYLELWDASNSALVEMDLAHIYMHIEKIEQAIPLLESARATWKSLDEPSGSAECALSIGDALTLLGKNEEAVVVYQLAAIDFEKAGNDSQVTLAQERAKSDLIT